MAMTSSNDTQWSAFRSSFQFKLFFIFTLMTFLISSLLSTIYTVSEVKKAERLANERLLLKAQNLADAVRLPLYAENRELLRQLAEQAVSEPEMRRAVITALDGKVVASSQTTDAPASSGLIHQTMEVRSLPVDSLETSLTGAHDAVPALIGKVYLEQGTEALTRAIRHVILIAACSALLFWLAVSLLSYLVLRKLTQSFNALMKGINVMQKGDFSSRIVVESNDEAGRAAHAVNELAQALQLRNEENNRLQEERLELERQMLHAQKLESLGVMAGGIAHDFNNLLQSILGNVELASMKLAPEAPSHKYISSAMNSARNAAHLTNLMLTYVGKGFITKKALNLNDLVRLNSEMLRSAATTAVSMELDLAPELPLVLADEAHVQQVVMNLILNASESIVEQPGLVKLTTGIQLCDQACLDESLLDEKPEPGRFVFLEVKDNGCGMSEETIKRLFDPFFTTKFTGRGLGMSAVMGIIRSHNGALFLHSELGNGTTFRVLFPVSDLELAVPDSQSGAVAGEADSAQESGCSGLALVVDDEKAVLRVCTKMAELCGFTVITACDGVDAVAKFREQAAEITVVLMDLTMPNMDGITAMGEIFKIKPDARVILSSGFNKEELCNRIAGLPPVGLIRKPYSLKVLEVELNKVMRGEYTSALM
jgi:signal transduction histidine kinase